MASLRIFAQRIRRLAGRVEKNANLVVINTAIAIDQVVVLATPVDTGRARGNWQVGVGVAMRGELDRLDTSGNATIAENTVRAKTRKLGQDIFISNNLPYIVSLNEGSSSQAPAGFVEEAVQVASVAVTQAKLLR